MAFQVTCNFGDHSVTQGFDGAADAENARQMLEHAMRLAGVHYAVVSSKEVFEIAGRPVNASVVQFIRDDYHDRVRLGVPTRKVAAIKLVRDVAHCGLKEAKDFVDYILR